MEYVLNSEVAMLKTAHVAVLSQKLPFYGSLKSYLSSRVKEV